MKIFAGVLAGLALAVVWVRRRVLVVTVDGVSMRPTFADGDRVLVRKGRPVRRGDVVVLEPPLDPSGAYLPSGPGADGRYWNLKRAVALAGDPVPPGIAGSDGHEAVPAGMLVVLGDNPDSVDSRQRGFYPADQVLGVVSRRINRH
ncbi:S26 family signal peptidase [Amycolatopsis xylanica]|uniref:S26 family signal peptidase n=1 Tax=Amycolatopsis xylanica TaxID=589385 RepID=UPI001C40A550|nr:S26 family signal peptidase [Amycolatopsis xylanica]